MPVITNRPGITGTNTTAPAAGTTPTTGTTPATAVNTSVDPAAGGTVPSTSAAALTPIPAVINGFGGKPVPSVNITLNPTPGQQGAREARSDADPEGWVARGFIDVSYAPAVGGVDVTVESHHSKPSDPAAYKGDEMVLYLQARVLDNGTEKIVTLSTLFDDVINPDGKSVGVRKFHVDYDAINEFLKTKSNGHVQLQIGDPLAVYAVWKKVGHQWGGFMREGYFESPLPLGKRSQVSVRTGGLSNAPEVHNTASIEKPIDITHSIPEAFTTKYPKFIEQKAKLVSRREHEQKFCPKTMDELTGVVKNLLAVSQGAPKEREKLLVDMFGLDKDLSRVRGKPVSGWSLSTTDRYYSKDKNGDYLLDRHGLPVVAPMLDVYQDRASATGDSRFPLARANMAARFRDGEIKDGETKATMGKLNLKTRRVVDPFSGTQTGLEISLDTKAGITKDKEALEEGAKYLQEVPAPYGILGELKKSNAYVTAEVIKENVVLNLANRYKYTLEHENGMKLEASMDFVHAGFLFETKVNPDTAALDEAGKFDFYADLLTKMPDDVLVRSAPKLKAKADDLNVVVLERKKDNGQGVMVDDLVMAVFWTDAAGAKHALEHPAVRFPQVEVELDHVQARTTGPVQQGYTPPTSTTTIANDTDQDAFLAAVTDKATMNGPPLTHTWEDLKDWHLYADHNYVQMQGAVVDFRKGLFPQGVDNARQKAAQALEIGGYVPKTKPALKPSLSTSNNINVSSDYQNPMRFKVSIYGSPPATPRASTLTIDWDNFPIRIPLKGTETPKEIADLAAARLDQAIFYSAKVTEQNGQFWVELTERT